MEAVLLTAPGSAEHFERAMLPLPFPGPDEVRIRIRAAGFNPMDWQKRKTMSPNRLPMILGGEVAGEIDAVGLSVRGFLVGDPVFAYLVRKPGGYAEYVCVRSVFVARKPHRLSFEQAAALPVAGLTAYESVIRAGVHPGDAVLVTGASGGVGTMAVQIARLRGASRIVATAGSDRSARYLVARLGIPFPHIVRYTGRSRANLAAAALQCNDGHPYRIAFDFVGGAMTSLCADVVDVDGHVVAIATGPRDATHGEPENDEDHLFDKSATVHFVLLSARAALRGPAEWGWYAQRLEELGQWAEAGVLRPPDIRNVGHLSVEAVRTAHQMLEEGHVQGKLVMSVGGQP
jgi:NADPH:quinone reductase-like Zn-dependent oxidoreductase